MGSTLDEAGKFDFPNFCFVAAKFLIEEDEEQMRRELKEAFRFYDKDGREPFLRERYARQTKYDCIPRRKEIGFWICQTELLRVFATRTRWGFPHATQRKSLLIKMKMTLMLKSTMAKHTTMM